MDHAIQSTTNSLLNFFKVSILIKLLMSINLLSKKQIQC